MSKENETMAKEQTTLNLQIPDAMADLLSKAIFETDKTKSEIVRCCILLALPTILKCPSLVHRIQVSDFKLNDK